MNENMNEPFQNVNDLEQTTNQQGINPNLHKNNTPIVIIVLIIVLFLAAGIGLMFIGSRVANGKKAEEPKPTEPSKPTDPTKPTNPTDPVEPTEPTEPTNPTNPTNPTPNETTKTLSCTEKDSTATSKVDYVFKNNVLSSIKMSVIQDYSSYDDAVISTLKNRMCSLFSNDMLSSEDYQLTNCKETWQGKTLTLSFDMNIPDEYKTISIDDLKLKIIDDTTSCEIK